MINGGDLGGIVATVAVMAVPVIAILTSHQRKMAMIIHGSQQTQSQNTANNEALTNEVRELKQMVYQQAIALDNLTSKLDKQASSEISNRLSGTQT